MSAARSRRRKLASFLIIAGWLLSAGPSTALSQNDETAEYPVKLAFLFNFTKFVEWPSASYREPGASLELCIVGDDPFRPELEGQLRTRTVGNHPVEVRTLRATESLTMCHIVFVPATEKDQTAKILKGLKGATTLTVGETDGFARRGGVVNLTVEENTVHFEINPVAAQRAGLKISAKLLALAKIVQDDGPAAAY